MLFGEGSQAKRIPKAEVKNTFSAFLCVLYQFPLLLQELEAHGSKFCLSSEVGNFTPAQPNSLVGATKRHF